MTRALALALLAASCSGGEQSREGADPAEATAPAPVPQSAAVMPSGHLTILEAPLPAPLTTLDDEPQSQAPDPTPDLAHPSVPPALRRFIRAFPQANEPNGAVLDLGSEHVVVLREGCFFLDRVGDTDPLVHFPLHVGLTVDKHGFLAFRSRYEGRSDIVRVGLPAQAGWFTEPYPAPPDVAERCGARTMVGVTTVSNPFEPPGRFLPVLRRFRDKERLTDAQTIARANACVRRQAAVAADRRLRGSKQEPPNCRMLWGY